MKTPASPEAYARFFEALPEEYRRFILERGGGPRQGPPAPLPPPPPPAPVTPEERRAELAARYRRLVVSHEEARRLFGSTSAEAVALAAEIEEVKAEGMALREGKS